MKIASQFTTSVRFSIAGLLLLLSVALTQGAYAQSSLVDVVAAGNHDLAMEMIHSGSNINSEMSDGSTALLYAAHLGDIELIAALIDAGADTSHSNEYGASAISEASFLGSTEILKMLIDSGVNVDWRNPEGETALMVVARAGNIEAAELLLDRGADINATESWGGQSPLMWATAQSQIAMMELLISKGADVNAHGSARLWNRRITSEPRPKDMNKGGFSPLLYAARQGCIECIAILTAAGAKLDATDPDRVTPLNLALINQHFDTAAALIEAGANVNKWDIFGRGPLFNAIDLNTLPVGGRPDIPSADVLTGYDIAVMLVERGANVNMQLKLRPPYRNAVFDRGADNVLSTGATPLMRATRAADNEVVILLLANGALADLPNSRGQTPLMVVAGIDWPSAPTRGSYKTEENSIETIRLLMEAGADINALTGNPAVRPETNYIDADRGAGMQPAIRGADFAKNQTALHGAAKQGWTLIVQYLIDRGARQESVDSAGRTPFDLAMGRYPPAFLDAPPVPFVETAMLLQQECLNNDNCEMDTLINFSNPDEIK